jgi:hypothetical protein
MAKLFNAKEDVKSGNQFIDKETDDRHTFDQGDPYPIDSAVAPVVIGYKNGKMIATDCAPEVPVDSKAFEYAEYDEADTFDVAETAVGRTSDPNELEFKGDKKSGLCHAHALLAHVPKIDMMQKRKLPIDPKLRAAELIMGKIVLAKEIRTRDVMQTAANYGSNTVQLSGTAQFSDYDNSDPDGVIEDALEALAMPLSVEIRKCMQMSWPVWKILRKHPQLVALLNSDNEAGHVTEEKFRQYYKLDELLIADSYYNAAGPGQAMDKQQIWGKHLSVFYKDPSATVAEGSGITFAMSPKFMDVAASGVNDKAGIAGVEWVKAGHVETTVITAPSYGYFVEDAIA